MLHLVINSLDELSEASKQLKDTFANATFFAFYGEMGAGKTTFIKEFCKTLGLNESVSSPTYSIVNQYDLANGKKIFHFDFYRIKNINEAFDMGAEEYFYSKNYCLVEWPEKIAELLPDNLVKVTISAMPNGQRVLEAINL
ncbi:MAG: tRNA (adenosine(37)-N6)-threonylcarbamoyltransferase complex ATPase subunit type 1 TsaE [Bacteroidota bacterium]